MPEYKYPGYGPTKEDWLTPRAKTKGGYHGGSDNPAEPGTPVYAQYGGEIFRTGKIDGYGMSVVVKSKAPDGTVFYQLYGHLGPDQLPAPGTPVVANQPIPGAVIGTTKYVQDQGGLTTGPHLHREIISGKVPLNADPNKRFGIYSSDITHKADPDAFDIDRSSGLSVPERGAEAGASTWPYAFARSRVLVTVRHDRSWRGRPDIVRWAERSGTDRRPGAVTAALRRGTYAVSRSIAGWD